MKPGERVKFQARHYNAIAEALKGADVAAIARLADLFKRDNPRFDSRRFFEACGTDMEDGEAD